MPLWKLPPLEYLQFPNRFLSVALLPFSLIAFMLCAGRHRVFILGVWGIGVILHSSMILLYAPHDYSGLLKPLPEHKIILPAEYVTKWQNDEVTNAQDQRMFRIISKDDYTQTRIVHLASGEGTLTILARPLMKSMRSHGLRSQRISFLHGPIFRALKSVTQQRTRCLNPSRTFLKDCFPPDLPPACMI